MLTVPDFPSALVSDDPRGHVSYEQLKADRIVVEKPAAHLRRPAILAGYPGLEHKESPETAR
jgi:hypothetical protein